MLNSKVAAVFAFSATMLILYYAQGVKEETALKQLAAIASNNMELPELTFGRTPATTKTPETPVMPEQYWALHEQNADMAGWIKIDGMEIDCPVMYTADNFYLSHGFDKKESRSGVPFID